MSYELDFIVKATGGDLISSKTTQFSGFSTDNRDPAIKGKIFIPLVGENHDAHQYVAAAIKAGASGAIVHQWSEEWEVLKKQASFIQVGDTLKALQDFSKAWRKQLSGTVIGLTGSNGKTTTKDFLFQILQHFGNVNASKGSFNNHWGVPFTLLETPQDFDYCVVEMGMNHSGEISQLMTIADPDVVTVTNVGRAHIGNFTNGIEGVAAAKEEIYENSSAATKLIFNLDNPWTLKMFEKYMDKQSYTFSAKNFSADVYLKIKERTAKGLLVEGQIGGVIGKSELSFWGDHNVQNLSAAVALAYMSGCRPEQIWPLLKDCHCGWGRNQWVETKSGAQVLFDGYNANPDSFAELLKNLQQPLAEGRKAVAVFGEMLELGEQASEQHRVLGELAGQLAWDQCLFIGPSGPSFLEGWRSSKNEINPVILGTYKDSLDLDLHSMVDHQSLIIVKGSRGSALERIVDRFDPIGFTYK